MFGPCEIARLGVEERHDGTVRLLPSMPPWQSWEWPGCSSGCLDPPWDPCCIPSIKQKKKCDANRAFRDLETCLRGGRRYETVLSDSRMAHAGGCIACRCARSCR